MCMSKSCTGDRVLECKKWKPILQVVHPLYATSIHNVHLPLSRMIEFNELGFVPSILFNIGSIASFAKFEDVTNNNMNSTAHSAPKSH